MIEIRKSSTADTRTCDWAKVDREQLLESSHQHIVDVQKGMGFLLNHLAEAANKHDFTKIRDLDDFHRDFKTGFKTQDWYEMHKKCERHHLAHPEGIRDDVNLVDVIEYLTDCVMAGLGRSGKVSAIEISNETLQKAFQNTVTLLKDNVRVVD